MPLIFGNLRFDMSARELVRLEPGGATTLVPLGSRATDILILFLRRPGDLIGKDEIMSTVWPTTAVEESNLTVQISALRRALDVGRDGTSAIATVPGRGYRFTLQIRESGAAAASPVAVRTPDAISEPAEATTAAPDVSASVPDSRGHGGARTWMALGGAAVLLAILAAGVRWGGLLAGDRPPSAATAPQYYNRGLAFVRSGKFEDAIADFNDVIRLDPWFTPAYLQRAAARRFTGDYDGAIADAGKVIELAPEEHRGPMERANDYLAKGDFARAIADYDASLRLTPDSDESLLGRGRAYFFSGEMSKAQADFQTCAKLRPQYFLPVMWLGVVERRAKLPGGLGEAERRLNMTGWPGPIVSMLAGEITPAQAFVAAGDKDGATRQRRICQTSFYAGEVVLSQDNRQEAARLFRLAANDCPATHLERQSAATELQALDKHP